MSGNNDQYRFGDDGELEEPDDDENDEEQLVDDWGNERPWYLTRGRYRRDIVTSLLQKGVRRSAEEETAWAAWELARSGLTEYVFERLNLFVIEDLRAGHEVALLIERYEELATERWDPDSWRGRICTIHAALAAARAPSSRESTYANGAFDSVAQDRVRADQEEDHETVFDPVVSEAELDPDGRIGRVVADRHSYPGSARGRDWHHFRIHGSRTGPNEDTEVGDRWRRQVLRAEQYGYREDQIEFTDKEIDHATEPTDADDPWRCDLDDDDAGLDQFNDEA
ncbi:hypothetical protein ACFQMF_03130 [Halorubrum rutilum]|uniref:Uncharacterized protein n=1 Tax=Halorubrum rutilum TaxID=1364933 RepID=A0ABD6AH11_9EURY|nr:hypothetical protein [Halorubrum rutilum]